MKKMFSLLAVTVLTLSLLAGCGCRNSRPAETTLPTMLPTVTTEPMTEPTTVPTTMATTPTDATIEDGNGPLPTDATDATDDSASRMIPGGTGSGSGITGSITG